MRISIETLGEPFSADQLRALMDSIESVTIQVAPYAMISATRDYTEVEREDVLERAAWRDEVVSGDTNMGFYDWQKESRHQARVEENLKHSGYTRRNRRITQSQYARYDQYVRGVDTGATIMDLETWLESQGEQFVDVYDSREQGDHPVYTRDLWTESTTLRTRVPYDVWVQCQIEDTVQVTDE